MLVADRAQVTYEKFKGIVKRINDDPGYPLSPSVRSGRVDGYVNRYFQGPIFNFALADRLRFQGLCQTIVAENHKELLEMVAPGGNPNYIHKFGTDRFIPLHLAGEIGNPRLAKQLLDMGAEVDPKEVVTLPLLSAADMGHLEVVKLLLEHHSPVERYYETHNGERRVAMHIPLLAAVAGGHVEVARLLLERGADTNICEEHGETPLKYVSRPRNQKIGLSLLELLVGHGGDLNQEAFNGTTPVFGAVSDGKPRLLQRMAELGANLHVKDNFGRDLMYRAVNCSAPGAIKLEMIEFLAAHGLPRPDQSVIELLSAPPQPRVIPKDESITDVFARMAAADDFRV